MSLCTIPWPWRYSNPSISWTKYLWGRGGGGGGRREEERKEGGGKEGGGREQGREGGEGGGRREGKEEINSLISYGITKGVNRWSERQRSTTARMQVIETYSIQAQVQSARQKQ